MTPRELVGRFGMFECGCGGMVFPVKPRDRGYGLAYLQVCARHGEQGLGLVRANGSPEWTWLHSTNMTPFVPKEAPSPRFIEWIEETFSEGGMA